MECMHGKTSMYALNSWTLKNRAVSLATKETVKVHSVVSDTIV